MQISNTENIIAVLRWRFYLLVGLYTKESERNEDIDEKSQLYYCICMLTAHCLRQVSIQFTLVCYLSQQCSDQERMAFRPNFSYVQSKGESQKPTPVLVCRYCFRRRRLGGSSFIAN